MKNVKLELSGESMDALFVDLLNDNLETILYTGTEYIHVEDYSYNLTLADAIMTLMAFQTDTFVFDKWCADVYWPMVNEYEEKYQLLTYKDEL